MHFYEAWGPYTGDEHTTPHGARGSLRQKPPAMSTPMHHLYGAGCPHPGTHVNTRIQFDSGPGSPYAKGQTNSTNVHPHVGPGSPHAKTITLLQMYTYMNWKPVGPYTKDPPSTSIADWHVSMYTRSTSHSHASFTDSMRHDDKNCDHNY